MEDLIKGRFRFNDEFDLYLAREVCGQNPYEDPRRWSIIQTNMLQITGRSITTRTLRERIQNLVKKHLTKTQLNEGKSGIEELVSELDDVLQQIVDLIIAFKNKPKTGNLTKCRGTTNCDKSSFQKGFETREKCVANMQEIFLAQPSDTNAVDLTECKENECPEISETIEVEYELPVEITESNASRVSEGGEKTRCLAQANILSPPVRKRRCTTNVRQQTIHYLGKKSDRHYEIRSRELDLAEKKQMLKEQQFKVEAEERQKRLQIEERRLTLEEKRLNVHLEIFANQQSLMKIILQKNK